MESGRSLHDAYARVSAALASEGGVGAGGWAALLEYYKTLRFALMDLATETTGMAWAARAVCDAGNDAVSLLRAAIDAGSGAPDAQNSDLVLSDAVTKAAARVHR